MAAPVALMGLFAMGISETERVVGGEREEKSGKERERGEGVKEGGRQRVI